MRTYARFLGIDPEEAVAEFNRTQDVAPAATYRTRSQRSAAPRTRPSGALIWVAGAVAVILIAFVVYNELALRAQQGSTPALPRPLARRRQPRRRLRRSLRRRARRRSGGANSLALVLSAAVVAQSHR